jgi:hypothetical protein
VIARVDPVTYERFYYMKRQAEKLFGGKMSNEEFLQLMLDALDKVVIEEKRRRTVFIY